MKVGYASIKIGKYGRKCAAYINDFDEDTVDVSWPGQHWGSYERDIVKVISQTKRDEFLFKKVEKKL